MLRNCFFWGIQGIQRGFDFKGRACRREVWSYSLLIIILNLIIYLISIAISEILSGILSLVMFVVFIIPGISSCVRRLHDINLSGKWLFLLYGTMLAVCGYMMSIVFQVIGIYQQNSEMAGLSEDQQFAVIWEQLSSQFMIALILFVLNFIISIVFLVLMLRGGTAGDNRYGAPHDYIDRDCSINS